MVRTSATTAKVLLLTDVNSSVTGRVQTTGATGVVRGRADRRLAADEPKLVMEKIPQGDRLPPGDLVIRPISAEFSPRACASARWFGSVDAMATSSRRRCWSQLSR